jgi:hypothetical protein
MVAYSYNPRYSRGIGRRIMVQALGKKHSVFVTKRTGSVAQVVKGSEFKP